MADYISYFLESPRQIVALASVGIVWLGFTSLGAVVVGRERLRAFDPLIGWALLSLVFTVCGVFLKMSFTPLALIAAASAAGAAVVVWRRDGAIVPAGLVRILVMTLPLLVLVSAMRGSQWDEFSDWLIIPRYMLETDAFPSRENPFTKAVFTGYPYSWHFITYLASRIAGHLLENAGALMNTLLLLTFGLGVLHLIGKGLGRDDLARSPGWTVAALGALAATLVNPTFAQKVALTSYADTSSAVATGTAAILAWLLLEALADGKPERARPLAWQLGAVLMLLVNLKQATLVLMVLVTLATLFIALRDPRIRVSAFLRLIPMIVLPTVVIYVTWRYHVSMELTRGELSIRPFDTWAIPLIPDILARMFLVLSKKGYYLALVAIIVGFGVRGFLRSTTSLDRFAALTAMVVLGYNAFLFFAYVASFGEGDALRAASYWRYNMHLGLVVVAFSAYGAAVLWRHRVGEAPWPRRVAWLPVVLLVAVPFVFAEKLRFDKVPLIVHFRSVGAAAATLVEPSDGVFVVDPTGSGESGMITAYEIGRRAHHRGYLSAFVRDRLKALNAAIKRDNVSVLVVHSTIPDYRGVLPELATRTSYLLKRDGDGWRIVASWPYPPGA